MDNLDYGVIGNCQSAALISKSGSIDWCCLPYFSSASVFAAILDENIGGKFYFETAEEYHIQQNYEDKTNILATRFTNSDNDFEIIDFMPRYKKDHLQYYNPPDIIRYIKVHKGKPKVKINYNPKPNYARSVSKFSIHKDYLKSYTTKGQYESIYLYTNASFESIVNKEEVELEDNSYFLISYNQKIIIPDLDYIILEYTRTKVYWMDWVQKTPVFEKFNDHIIRSALVLKLLTYQKTGAILAAITTSLPETIGEVRNWDYRFCWIRDASMIIKTLRSIGHKNAANRYINFIIDAVPLKDEKIQIMYGINGEKKLTEKFLDHLDGYKGSKPVRIGNAAYTQKQNDIYGVLLDVFLNHVKYYESSTDILENIWTITRSMVKVVKNNWKKPDMSIWEFRSMKKHYVFSKVLCWVAVDRGVKIAQALEKDTYVKEWDILRNKIKKDIYEKGWNEKAGAFTQAYGTTDMDAANLLMHQYGFIEGKDPKFVSTVKQIYKELSKDGLMFRYKNIDDFGEPSSSFTICSFWMIESLYAIGEEKEANDLFDRILNYSNHLGLFSEDIDFKTKRLLGNFPQGYSHLALIETAIKLSEGKKVKKIHHN
jgi:GH15 family glucan-1,4-alpha-glucosidase